MTLVTAVINQKGGVGKTTITANLSALAGEAGARVLAIDADPQHALTRQSLSLEAEAGLSLDLSHVLRQEATVDQVWVRATSAEFDLIPSSRSLAAAEIGLVVATHRETRLTRALQPVVDAESYDHIFIDAPPNLGLLTVNALAACDRVLIPVSAEDEGAVRGVAEVLMTLEELYDGQELPAVSAVVTKWDKRLETAQAVDSALRHFTAAGRLHVLDAYAPHRALNTKAAIIRRPAVTIPPSSETERDVRRKYKAIARELDLLPKKAKKG